MLSAQITEKEWMTVNLIVFRYPHQHGHMYTFPIDSICPAPQPRIDVGVFRVIAVAAVANNTQNSVATQNCVSAGAAVC